MDISAPRVEAFGLIYMYGSRMSVCEGARKKEAKGDECRNGERELVGKWKALRPNPGRMVSLSF